MSENQNRGTNNFSKYDSMATEELEEILRLDAEVPEGQESDEELLLYVMGVLAARKRNSDNPGKTAQEAWESFQKHYLPAEEECLEHTGEAKKPVRTASPWLRRLIATAAVLTILVCIPFTASAFGWEDIWNAVAKWAKETFSFVSADDTQASEPATDDIHQYASLQQLLAETDQEFDFVPTWIPEGYELKKITMDEMPERKAYVAFYSNGEKALMLQVTSYLTADPEKVEINEELLEVYESSGTEYYIFANVEQYRTVWIKDSYECYISGDLTIEEIKMMIDSIGKG